MSNRFSENDGAIIDKKIILMIVIAFGLLSCATQSKNEIPKNPNNLTSVNFETTIKDAKEILVVIDSCIMEENVYSIEHSKTQEKNVLKVTKAYLENKGYEVLLANNPFICAQLKDNEKIKYARKGYEEYTETLPPIYLSSNSRNHDQYDIYVNTIKNMNDVIVRPIEEKAKKETESIQSEVDEPIAQENVSNSETPVETTHENIFNSYIKLISQNTDYDIVMVIVHKGVVVSQNKTTGYSMLTGMATGMLTGGLMVMAAPASYSLTYAAMYDPRTGQLIWSNSSGGGGKDVQDFRMLVNHYSYAMYYHIPNNKIAVDSNDGLNEREIRALLAGNTVKGYSYARNTSYTAFLSYAGTIHSESFGEVRYEGDWYINDKKELCIRFDKLFCGTLRPGKSNLYQFESKDKVIATIENIESGDRTGFTRY